MARFVKVETTVGPVLINPEHVVRVEDYTNSAVRIVFVDGTDVYVDEPMGEMHIALEGRVRSVEAPVVGPVQA